MLLLTVVLQRVDNVLLDCVEFLKYINCAFNSVASGFDDAFAKILIGILRWTEYEIFLSK